MSSTPGDARIENPFNLPLSFELESDAGSSTASYDPDAPHGAGAAGRGPGGLTLLERRLRPAVFDIFPAVPQASAVQVPVTPKPDPPTLFNDAAPASARAATPVQGSQKLEAALGARLRKVSQEEKRVQSTALVAAWLNQEEPDARTARGTLASKEVAPTLHLVETSAQVSPGPATMTFPAAKDGQEVKDDQVEDRVLKAKPHVGVSSGASIMDWSTLQRVRLLALL
ncbi:hypothetical protein DL93DRAFT_2082057, partial [Clavulina sp. PMI_390]